MSAAAITPSRGIRLKGGAPIPPAPAWGVYRPVTLSSRDNRHIGGVTEITPGHHVPVCVNGECYRALPACDTYGQGKRALRDHWTAEHAGGSR